jgi:general secretion pathway protein D
MAPRSVNQRARRPAASHRNNYAPAALTLSLLLSVSAVFAQAPASDPPESMVAAAGDADRAKSPPLPPQSHDDGAAPTASGDTLPPPAAPANSPVQLAAPGTAGGSHALTKPPINSAPPKTAPVPKESEDLAKALERPGDLNLHGLTLNAALFTIGEQWNINIVAGDLQGNVNGVFKQAPLREILDSILLSNGYNYRVVGKSLVISSVAELGQVNPFFQSATITVQNADIEEVVQGAQLLTTPKGQVRALKSAHSIVVLDFPDRVKMIREFVKTLDSAGNGHFQSAENRGAGGLEVGYFRTQHIAIKTAEQAIIPVMSKVGKCAIMEKEDRLIAADYPENLAMIGRVLQEIDHPRPQVRIVALMYDISLEDIQELGINWKPTLKGRIDSAGDAQTSLGVDSVTKVPFAADSVGNTLTFMNLSRNFDITTVARCLQNTKDARLLADPNVAVLENEDAILEKVSEIPYQQLTQTSQGGNIGTTAFKKVGITLTVRPKIAVDGIIRMDVKPEVSRLTGFTPGDNQPIVDTSSASTVLTIANRQTVAIGGLRQRQDVGEFTGVPYLKDLSLVGRLFRSRDTDVRESELVVFIMPEIISYDEQPTCRQLIAADTIGCRLDQIPEAEGCPPCCRRLPAGMVDCGTAVPGDAAGSFELPPGTTPAGGEYYRPESAPSSNTPQETLPAPPNLEFRGPMSATQIPSAEFQFGAAGRTEQVRALVADGRLRRLPFVASADSKPLAAAPTKPSIFPGPSPESPPPSPIEAEALHTADRDVSTSAK